MHKAKWPNLTKYGKVKFHFFFKKAKKEPKRKKSQSEKRAKSYQCLQYASVKFGPVLNLSFTQHETVYVEYKHKITRIAAWILERGMDWQRYSILYMIFGSVTFNKPETNIAQLAMVIMRINEIEFMSIITIRVGQCLLPVC